jgi:hypothetical protein
MGSTASYYQIFVRDQSYAVIGIFDQFTTLSYTLEVNGACSYEFSINGADPRASLFELDGIVEIWRAIPGCLVPWYREFIGLHRVDLDDVDEKGNWIYKTTGVGLNDFLGRTIINYPPATIKSYKNAPSETAMKEYVEENCGASATIANEREIDGVLPDFQVAADGASGVVWEGDRAWENLLDILKEISKFSQIDFNVSWDDLTQKFVFETYVDQLGEDRTTVGLDPATGLNSAGNPPVSFALELGNISSLSRTFNRLSESNVVTVLGEGEGATVATEVRTTAATLDSPWNRREVSRSKSGFQSEMQTYGDGVLVELSAKDIIDFSPLSQEACLYGKHFFIGDKVTVTFKGISYNKRIFSITNSISEADKKEKLSIVFSDLQ